VNRRTILIAVIVAVLALLLNNWWKHRLQCHDPLGPIFEHVYDHPICYRE
jgi:hypothetical protein